MEKNFNTYESKNISLSVKDIDSQTRRVKMELAHFNNIDSDRDVIRKGAFAKSISERGADTQSNRKIAFLRYHNFEHQIGKFISLEETDYALVGLAELGRSTKGNDAFLDYQDGIIREHSIGFNYIADKIQLIGEGETAYFEVKEVVLWEGSAVTFGANELTPTLDVSKGNKEEVLTALNDEMSAFITALKNGKGTDERLYSIEMGLKVCQQKYNSLINSMPFVKSTLVNEPNSEQEAKLALQKIEQDRKNYYLNLLKN
jgi:HK97 family phage prohead protease